MPFAVLASGRALSDSSGCHFKMEIQRPPDVFTCFSRLPLELRCVIWKHALPEPRVVQAVMSGFPEEGIRFQLHPDIVIGHEHLLTCRESSDVFQRTYSKLTVEPCVVADSCPTPKCILKDTSLDRGDHDATVPVTEPIGYLDPINDTLVVRETDLNLLADHEARFDLTKVQRLVLVYRGMFMESPWTTIEKECPSLREFSFVYGFGYDFHNNNYNTVFSELEVITADHHVKDIDIQCHNDDEVRNWNLDSNSEDQFTEEVSLVNKITHDFFTADNSDVDKDLAFWENVEFRPALLAGAVRNTSWVREETSLRPTQMEPFDVLYWMERRVCRLTSSSLYLFDLDCWTSRGADGVLHGRYDGILKLFEGDETRWTLRQ